MKKVAIDIETKIWAEIIRVLRKEGWIVTEGEIRAKESLLSKIEEKHKIKFKYGEPSNLKRSVIVTFKLQSLPLWILNRFNFLDNKL